MGKDNGSEENKTSNLEEMGDGKRGAGGREVRKGNARF